MDTPDRRGGESAPDALEDVRVRGDSDGGGWSGVEPGASSGRAGGMCGEGVAEDDVSAALGSSAVAAAAGTGVSSSVVVGGGGATVGSSAVVGGC